MEVLSTHYQVWDQECLLVEITALLSNSWCKLKCFTHSSSSLFSSYHCYCHLPFFTSATSALTTLDHSGGTWSLTLFRKLTRLLSLQLSRVLRLLKYPAEDSENPPQVNAHFCLLVYWFGKCTVFTMWCLRHLISVCEITAKPWTRVGPFIGFRVNLESTVRTKVKAFIKSHAHIGFFLFLLHCHASNLCSVQCQVGL